MEDASPLIDPELNPSPEEFKEERGGDSSEGTGSPCPHDFSDTDESSEFGFDGQDELLLRGLNTVVSLPSSNSRVVGRDTDRYIITEYRALCFAIEKWVQDAQEASVTTEEPWSRLSALIDSTDEDYQKKFGNAAIQRMYLSLIQEHEKTNILALSYVVHWIMYNLWEDVLDPEFPRGLTPWLKQAIDHIDDGVLEASCNRQKLRFRQWFCETMVALTVHPLRPFVKSRKEDVDSICDWHFEHLRAFFGYNEMDHPELEQRYKQEVVGRAVALHRFKTCSIFGYRFHYCRVPLTARPEDQNIRRYKHVDTLAVIAPVLVGYVYRLPLYPALVRLKRQDEGGDERALAYLESPTFIAHQKPPAP